MRLPFLRKDRKSAPEPDHLLVPAGADEVRVALRRKAGARRMTLRVATASGEVVLSMPERVDIASAERFARAHGGWIAARLAKRPARVLFRPGALVPLRGEPHRIMHWSNVRGLTRATRDAEGQPIIAVSGEPAHVPRRIADFLKAEARRDLEAAAARHAAALGVPAGKITIRDTSSRWGSCSSRGDLSFSWRLVLAPDYVLDYLAAHEAAHLKEMNHSHRFWAIVHRLCPRTEEAEAWLRRHGATLHAYG